MKLLLFSILWLGIVLNYSFSSKFDYDSLNNSLLSNSLQLQKQAGSMISELRESYEMPGHRERVEPYYRMALTARDSTTIYLDFLERTKSRIKNREGDIIFDKNTRQQIQNQRNELLSVYNSYLWVGEPDRFNLIARPDYHFAQSEGLKTGSRKEAIAFLNSLQLDMLMEQNTVLQCINRYAMPMCGLRFETIAAIAFPLTTNAFPGQKVTGKVIFGEYDIDRELACTSNSGGTIKIERGMATWKSIASKPGLNTAEGFITTAYNNRKITQPWSVQYRVGPGALFIEHDKGNVVHRYVPVAVTINVPGGSQRRLDLWSNAGKVKRMTNNKFSILVDNPDLKSFFITAVETKDGRIDTLCVQRFKVGELPKPIAFIKSPHNNEIAKEDLDKNLTIELHQPDDDFYFNYKIVSFHVQPIIKGDTSDQEPIIIQGDKFQLNGTRRGLLQQCHKIYLTDITAIGPGNKEVILNAISLTVR